MGFHYFVDAVAELGGGFIGKRGHGGQEIEIETMRHQVECGRAGQYFAGIEDESGDDSLAGLNAEPESAVVEGFDGLFSFVTGAFGIKTHVEPHR